MFRRYKFKEGLTSLVGSQGKILINYLGHIKDINGIDLPTLLDNEGHITVELEGWDGYRSYRIIDLMVIQYKGLRIPLEDYNKVIGFVIDGDKTNVQAKNVGYRFLDGKLEVKGHSGFYYIPMCTSRAIDIAGKLLTVSTGNIAKWFITKPNQNKNIKGGYYTFGLIEDSGKESTISRHRVKSLVFKEYPDDVDSLVVNHIDGVPGNDDLANLEWTTRGRNNIHAYENGLKNQNMYVLARDVRTGEVTEYYSISECARQLGYPTDETIRFRLIRCDFGKVFSDGFQFKLKTDTRDWIIPDDPIQAICDAQAKISVKIRNCFTMDVVTYVSIMKAAKATGVNNGSILYRLSKDDRSPLRGFQFITSDDTRPFPDFTIEEVQKTLQSTTVTVDARNLLTGEALTFESIAICENRFKAFSIAYAFRKRKQPILKSGWQFKPSTDEWINVDNPEQVIYEANSEIVAREEVTGKIIIASSAQQLGYIFNCCPKEIRKRALKRGATVWRGYRFRLGISNNPWPTTV